MDKYDKKVLTIKREILFENKNEFNGFLTLSETKINEKIKKENHSWIVRRDAEYDSNYKQLIPYVIIYNEDKKEIFAYQRSPKQGDERLQSKWSIGVGGHIDDIDYNENENNNPIEEALKRELNEELNFKVEENNFELIGFINDESNSVGSVHLGVVYLIKTKENKLNQDNFEIVDSGFKTINELKKLAKTKDVETWSELIINKIDKIIEKI